MASRRGPDDTVRLSISGVYGGAHWANIFWARLTKSGVIPQANFDTWLTNFAAAYDTAFDSFQRVEVERVTANAVYFAPGGGELLSTLGLATTGDISAGDPLPANIAAPVSWSAGVYWRGGKPRTYIVGIDSTYIDNELSLEATFRSNLANAASDFRTAVNALTAGAITDTELGFVSFRSGNAERVPPVFFPFIAAQVHGRVGSQRRRLGVWQP